MPHSSILDGGTRFPEVMTVRLPGGFLERIRAAAAKEGIAPTDFARRAVADRLDMARLDPAGGSAAPAHTEPRPSAAQSSATPAAPVASPAPTVTPPAHPQTQAAEDPAQSPRSRTAWTRP